jgi:dTDP-L-rhamnose 4-epimerase
MSIYGEGRYRDSGGGVHDEVTRSVTDLKQGRWEPRVEGATSLEPVPTPEQKRPMLSSVYALSKYDQEQLCLMVGRAYGISTVALRFFNTYGPRQALSNPYTGVLAIFASRILNGKPPLVFEDGKQLRDFVSVHDVARACRLALESERAAFRAINVGSGRASGIVELGTKLARVLGRPELLPEVTRKYRVGDIRHCFSDIQLASELLQYSPQVSLEEGMLELGNFLKAETPLDRSEVARDELEARGLTL